jgi:hypothetical protein
MTIEAVAALLFRIGGVVLLLLGLFSIAGTAMTYAALAQLRNVPQMQDTYYVVGNWTFPAALVLIGALCLVFSRPLGRVLAKGLQ